MQDRTYSLPSRLMGKRVTVWLYADHLEVYYRERLVERRVKPRPMRCCGIGPRLWRKYTASELLASLENAYCNLICGEIVVASTFWLIKAVSNTISLLVAAKISRFTCSLRHSCTRRCSVRSCAPVG